MQMLVNIMYFILILDFYINQIYNKLEFFVEDAIYWAPASTTAHLYSQLASKKYREIPRDQLRYECKPL